MKTKAEAKPKAAKAKELKLKKNTIYQNKDGKLSVIIRAIPEDAGDSEKNFYIVNVLTYNERGGFIKQLQTATAKELRDLLDLNENIKMVFTP